MNQWLILRLIVSDRHTEEEITRLVLFTQLNDLFVTCGWLLFECFS